MFCDVRFDLGPARSVHCVLNLTPQQIRLSDVKIDFALRSLIGLLESTFVCLFRRSKYTNKSVWGGGGRG